MTQPSPRGGRQKPPGLKSTIDFLETIRLLNDPVDRRILLDQSQPDLAHYRRTHARRLWRSLAWIEPCLAGDRPSRILELGAMPYYFSAMLMNAFPLVTLVGINTRGSVWPESSSSPQEALTVRLGYEGRPEGLPLPVHILNLERDRFPFSSEDFDLVLCMEVLEHLLYSPTHMLAEAHRVLRPGGHLFISTPNAVDMRRTLAMLLNRSVGSPYSGYSIYGRHNREFTLREVRELCLACGYSIEHTRLENVLLRCEYPLLSRLGFGLLNLVSGLPTPYLKEKRENIFLVARRSGETKWAYPKHLYLFRHLYPSGPGAYEPQLSI
jgi:SAM-dependent methyltransferase